MTENQVRAVLRRAKFKVLKGGNQKPIPSRNVSPEEIAAADEVRKLIPQALIRWPRGVENSPEIYPLGDTDQEAAAIVRKLQPIERKED
jgi:hypothetical protein